MTSQVINLYTNLVLKWRHNPLMPVAISKQLEMIGRSAYILACSIATALHSDIYQTAGSGGHLSMWENRCMHATVCLLHAGQPRCAGDAAKSGQFIGQFTWVTGDPMGIKGLNKRNYWHMLVLARGQLSWNGSRKHRLWMRTISCNNVLEDVRILW